MVGIHIDPSDAMQLANNMSQWLFDMRTIHDRMLQRVRDFDDSWNDPQYHMFLDSLISISNNLRNGIESLEQMCQTLQVMARRMDEDARNGRQGLGRNM